MSIGFLLIRLVVGLTLAAHGSQKLFAWFGGPGLEGAGRFMETLGFVPGRRSAFLAGITEWEPAFSLRSDLPPRSPRPRSSAP